MLETSREVIKIFFKDIPRISPKRFHNFYWICPNIFVKSSGYCFLNIKKNQNPFSAFKKKLCSEPPYLHRFWELPTYNFGPANHDPSLRLVSNYCGFRWRCVVNRHPAHCGYKFRSCGMPELVTAGGCSLRFEIHCVNRQYLNAAI